MFAQFPIAPRAARHLPLAATIATLFGLAAPCAFALDSITVLSCTDGGIADTSVNLRNSIAVASEGT